MTRQPGVHEPSQTRRTGSGVILFCHDRFGEKACLVGYMALSNWFRVALLVSCLSLSLPSRFFPVVLDVPLSGDDDGYAMGYPLFPDQGTMTPSLVLATSDVML